MGAKPGPKPKPTHLRLLEGNPGRLPINEREPIDIGPLKKLPAVEADEIASQEWDRLISAMPPDLYTAADAAALASYAFAWSMLVKAQQEINLNGVMVTIYETDSETGERQVLSIRSNPAVKVWKAASETLIKLSDRLGLTPGVRSRLQLPSRSTKPTEGRFAGLLGRNE
jgi:P27 family predicted phage terminase small subunit